MEIDNSFEVPLPPDRAWATLMDIERIAPCMPGAELTEIIDERTFRGKVSVRLGPVALTFEGQAAFEEVDDDARTALVRAQGSDAKGRGGAQARITFGLEPSEAGSTVNIHTDVQLSGSVAQYGRGVGMIQDLAGRIIGQFAENLAARIEEESEAGDEPAAAAPADAPASAPVEVGGMAAAVLWQRILGWIRRLFGGQG